MRHEKHPFQLRAEAHLARSGGFFTFEDILSAIEKGDMQSFAEGSSWAVTQVIQFPRKKVVDVVLLVGCAADFEALTNQVKAFGKRQGADFIIGSPRKGFLDDQYRPKGWKVVGATIMMELDNDL